MSAIAELFSPDGALAEHLPGFSYREPQQRMAGLVSQALENREHAVIEAGTGIGKTFAYVVPVLLAGKRAIVSTGTRTLQDQLYARDLPALGRALGRPVDIALLKGRANYLCWHRLENARQAGKLKAAEQRDLDALARWGSLSEQGDLTEIDDIDEDFRLKARVTSTVDNCLGNQCEFIEQCFVIRARRRAQAARVVIVNHHLLLADLSLRETGFGELLPEADAVIVDEAHLFPEIAQQFFDVSVSSRQLVRLGHDIVDEARVAGAGSETEDLGAGLAKRMAPLIADAATATGRMTGVPSRFAGSFDEVCAELRGIAEGLEGFERDPGLARCRERAELAAAKFEQILSANTDTGLKWFDAGDQGFSAHFTPFDIGAALGARIEAQGGGWVFTSASLAVRKDFGHFTRRIGITPGIQAVLPSPFDYAAQGGLYLPAGLPAPNEPGYTEDLLESVWPLLVAADGGAFILFTSHRALSAAQIWLSHRRLPGPLLVQGTGPRSQLLDRFRAAGNAILLGTGSFWQGVDVRGSALRIVVIDKLPFAVPNDPMIQARIEAVRRDGKDSFSAFQLPEAVLALKQGVGRLIRDFDDYGLVVIGDPRLRTRSYGKVFIESLPAFTRIDDAADALSFAETLLPAPETLSA